MADLEDFQPEAWYFRFNPPSHLARNGPYGTALMGDCVPDQIYETHDPQTAQILRDLAEDWEEESKTAYESQTADSGDDSTEDDDSTEEEQGFACTQCDRAFGSAQGLATHKRMKHSEDSSDDETDEADNAPTEGDDQEEQT